MEAVGSEGGAIVDWRERDDGAGVVTVWYVELRPCVAAGGL